MAVIKRRFRRIKERATAAAYALLGIIPPAAAAESKPWNVDASFLRYTESGRIDVTEPSVSVTKPFANDRSLGVMVTVDSISGSTPIGTLPQAPGAPVTTTSPSGHATTSNPGVVIPMSHYSDTRFGTDGSWKQPLGFGLTGVIGGEVSKQSDFLSYGGNISLAKDFNQKNTTVMLGLSPEFDTNKPHGGVPVPLSSQLAPTAISADKRVIGLLAGLTQVINPRTLMQWNFSQTRENGYLTDPYKQLSIVNSVTGAPVGSIYERRPASRIGNSLYWLTKYSVFSHDVISGSYRFFEDNWGIRSHTVDLNYHWQFNEQGYFEPHFRFYHQSAADFFNIGLVTGQPLPLLASADYRLAQFNGITGGLRYGWTFNNGSLFAIRLEYYTQRGNNHPDSAVGIQRGFNLFPTLQATVFQIQYNFDPARFARDFAAGS